MLRLSLLLVAIHSFVPALAEGVELAVHSLRNGAPATVLPVDHAGDRDSDAGDCGADAHHHHCRCNSQAPVTAPDTSVGVAPYDIGRAILARAPLLPPAVTPRAPFRPPIGA